MATKQIDLGGLQDKLVLARKAKRSSSAKLHSAQQADIRAGEELGQAQSEFDAAFHAVRNQ